MFRLAIGFAIGYVLGAKAGHERYEQIRRLSSMVSDSPAVQGVAGFVEAKIGNSLPGKKHDVRDLMLPISSMIRNYRPPGRGRFLRSSDRLERALSRPAPP
jgi:hypothetical protein